MPFNPEEIGQVAKGVEGAAAAIEKSGGVGKVAEEAGKTVRTFARDAKGRFVSAAKSVAKGGIAGAAGAEIKDALSGNSNQAQDENESSSDQTNGPSKTRETPNPGAQSPAGRIDLPEINNAADIAGSIDDSGFSDTRGKGSGGTQDNNPSNRKLNKIINLLESILSTEKRNTRIMGSGFRNVEEAIYSSHNAMINNQQARDLENTSSGGGSFLGSISSNPAGYLKNSLKGLGVAALGAFAAGAAIDVIKDHGKKDNTHDAVSKTQDSIINVYKEEYGKNWAQKLISDDFDQQKDKKGFLEELANKQGPSALYLPIKEAYDKASGKDKQEIIDAIAALLKVSRESVEKQITHENIRAVQVAKAAETGMIHAAVEAASATVGGGIKYGGKAVGALSNAAGSAFDFFGAHGAGSFFKKEGSTISANATKKGDELSANIEKGNEYIPSTGKMEAYYNPKSYKAGGMAFDIGTAAFVPGGKVRLASMGLAGGLDMLGGDSSYLGKDTFQMKTPGGKELSPEAQERAKKAMAFFQSKGLSKEQAQGLVANLLVESNYTLDPHQGQIGGGGGYGIAQWTSKDRKEQFAKTEGTPLEHSTFEQQLDFVNWEFNHTEKKAGKDLKNAKTAGDASRVVTREYERPAAMDKQSDFRASYAEAISKQFDVESLKPDTRVASTNEPAPSINVSQGGTNISRNTTIQSASAAAPSYLTDSVTSTLGS